MAAVLAAGTAPAPRPVAWTDVRVEAERLLAEARAEAGRIAEAARTQAEALVAAAKQEAAKVLEEARTRGEAEGRVAGEAAQRAESQAAVQAALDTEIARCRTVLDAAAAALDAAPARFAARAESEAVALAVAVAELLAKRELKADPALVSGNVRAALEAIATAGRISLRLHPDDKTLIEARLPELARGLAAVERLSIQADPAVARGGCTAVAEGSIADASLEAQMAQIRRTLLGEGAR